MLFNGQLFIATNQSFFTMSDGTTNLSSDRCDVYLPRGYSRADAEKLVAAINVLIGAPPPKSFASFAQTLEGIPADALPDPKDGWDQFSQPKANQWLSENLTDRGYPITFTAILKSVELERVAPKDNPNATLYWIVEYKLDHFPFDFQNRRILAFIDSYSDSGSKKGIRLFRRDSQITITGDEAFARAAQALPAGTPLTFHATISRAEVSEQNPPRIRFLMSDPSLVNSPAAAE